MATKTRQLALMKKGQYYVFRYQPGDESALIHSLTTMASDPDCELDWFDAAILSHQMGQRMAGELRTNAETPEAPLARKQGR